MSWARMSCNYIYIYICICTQYRQYQLPTHTGGLFSVRTIGQRQLFQRIQSRMLLCNCIKPVMSHDKFLASISMRLQDNLSSKFSNTDLYFATILDVVPASDR